MSHFKLAKILQIGWMGLGTLFFWGTLAPKTFAQFTLSTTPESPVIYCLGQSRILRVDVSVSGTPTPEGYQYAFNLQSPEETLEINVVPELSYEYDLADANEDFPGTFSAGNTYYLDIVVSDKGGALGGNTETITVQIDVVDPPVPAFVTTTDVVCEDDRFTFEGAGGGAYTWSVANPTGSASAALTGAGNLDKAEFAFSGSGTVDIVLTVDNGGCSESIAHTVTVNPLPANGFTSFDPTVCSEDIVSYTAPDGASGATYVWTATPTPGVTATIPGGSARTKSITFANTNTVPGTVQIQVEVTTTDGCTRVVTGTVTVNPRPDNSFVQAAAASVCSDNSIPYEAPDGFPGGTYAWSAVNPESGNVSAAFTDPTISNPEVTFTNTGSFGEDIDIQVVVTTADGCARTLTQTVTVNPEPIAGVATVGDALICNDDESISFLVLTDYAGDIEWQITTTPSDAASWRGIGGDYEDSEVSPITNDIFAGAGLYYFRAKVTVEEPTCLTVFSNQVTITVEDIPVISNAAQTSFDLCTGTSTDLSFAVAGGTSLQWQASSGPSGPFTDISGANFATYTSPEEDADAAGNIITRYYRLQVRGGCQTVTSQVIRVQWFPNPTGTGPNTTIQPVCVGNRTQLVGASVNAPSSGIWTTSNGNNANFETDDPGTYSNPRNDPNAYYRATSGEAGRTVELVWNIQSTEACGITSFEPAQVYIQPDPVATITAPAGATVNICAPGQVLLSATAANGTGFFRFGAAGAAPAGSTALFETDGTTLYIPSVGGDAAKEVVLSIDPQNANESLVIEWVASDPDGTCSATSIAARTIAVRAAVLDGTFGDPGDIACAAEPLQLAATVGAGSIGRWGSSGSGVFSTLDPTAYPDARNDPNAQYTPSVGDISASPITLSWVITSVSCGSETLVLTHDVSIPTLAEGQIDEDAIPDFVCASGNTGPLNATVVFGNPGQWVSSTGNGTFTDINDPQAVYYPDIADAGTSIDLEWVVTSPDGCQPNTSRVSIFVDAVSSGSGANLLSDDQAICVTEPTVPLGATLDGTSTGEWSVIGGEGGFTSPSTNPDAQYIPLADDIGKTVTLRWTVVNGTCPPVVYDTPLFIRETSEGGFDNEPSGVCELQTTAPLAATTKFGVGTWEARLGAGPANGEFIPSDPDTYPNPLNDPNASYMAGIGDGGNEVVLVWTVQNADCTPVEYTQELSVDKIPEGSFDSPGDIVCYNTSVSLSASESVGQGTWHVVGGTGTFSDYTSPTSTYNTGTQDGNQTVQLIWRVGNGECDSLDYAQSIYISRISGTVEFSDLELCLGTSKLLQAEGGDTYAWSVLPAQPGFLVFDDATSATPIFNPDLNLPAGNYRVLVQINDTSTGCFDTDTINIEILTGDLIGLSASSDEVCIGEEITLTQTGGVFSGLTWQVSPSSSAIITDPTSPTTTAVILERATFSVSGVNSNGCTVEKSEEVDVFQQFIPQVLAGSNCEGNEGLVGTSFTTIPPPKLGYWFRGSAAEAEAAFLASGGNPDPEADTRWVDNNPIPDNAERDTLSADTELGTYTYAYVYVSTEGCVTYGERTITIRTQPLSEFTASTNELQFYSREIFFTSLSDDEVDELNEIIHVWDFGDPASGSDNVSTEINPSHVYSTFGLFPVTLYIENLIGCNNIEIKPNYISVADPNYSFPSVFTPNGDGLNDHFRPLPNTLDNAEDVLTGFLTPEANPDVTDFQVYDRWGNLIFRTNSEISEAEVPGWDGRIGGVIADAGSYTYRVVIDFGGSIGQRTYDGVVRLLR